MEYQLRVGQMSVIDKNGQPKNVDVLIGNTKESIEAVQNEGEKYISHIDIAGDTQISAVQTTGSEQIEAIENKGQETLNSIPEDYTSVVNDVNHLKSDAKTKVSRVGIEDHTMTLYSDESMEEVLQTVDLPSIEIAQIPNAIFIGEPLIVGSTVSRFTRNDYMVFPFLVDVKNKPFTVDFAFTTGSDVTTQQNILDSHFGVALAIQNSRGVMALSSNGVSWDIGVTTGVNIIKPNSIYHARLEWTGDVYKGSLSEDGITYIPDMTVNSSLGLYPETMYIGGAPDLFGSGAYHPFKGSIDMGASKLIVAGIDVWHGMDDAGLVSRANVSLSNLDSLGEARFAKKADKSVVDKLSEESSELKADLVEVKEAIFVGESEEIVDFEWIEDSYVNTYANGAFTPYVGWHRTDYIPIEYGEELNIDTVTTSPTQLYNAFYREDKSYIGKFLVNATAVITVPSDARYFALSTQSSNIFRRKIKISEISTDGAKEKLGIKTLENKVEILSNAKLASYVWSGNLSINQDIDTGYGYPPKDGLKFGFYGEFTTFDSIKIQLDAYSPNCIIVDSTKVTLKSRFMSDVVLPHNVTLEGHFFVNAICKTPSEVSVTISSNGIQNTVTGAFSVTAYEKFHLINGNTALTNCVFSFGCSGIKKDIWAIGDSYFGATNPARWVTYMYQNGYDKNTMFCGSTGSGATESDIWIPSLFAQGTPKILIWAHGMNYESDTTTPASTWLDRTQKLIERCNENGVEIVLCTIPTVPTKNHEKKNDWVRNSGHRYIDFAKAVGATADGQWHSGMISNDHIHPSETGAIALYNMAIATVPEFTY